MVEEGDHIVLTVDNDDAATNHVVRVALEFDKKTPGRAMEGYMDPAEKTGVERPEAQV